MAKTYTKAELFGKDMTLPKLQAIATTLEIDYQPTTTKGALATAIMKKQMSETLTTAEAAEPVIADNAATAKVVADVAAQNVAAAGADAVTSESEAVLNAIQGMPKELVAFLVGLEARVGKVEGVVATTVKNVEGNLVSRLHAAEGKVSALWGAHKDKGTLHGHIDNLPKVSDLPAPGKIDDLPKIGEKTA